MDPTPRRATDPDGEDFREQRSGGLTVGYRGIRLRLFGPEGLLILMVGAFLTISLWQSWDRQHEHEAITRGLAVTSCILTLTTDERVALRGRLSPMTLADFCPWLRDHMRPFRDER